MKYAVPLAVFALLFCGIFCAGCIGLGTTTSDIMLGDQKVGEITLAPVGTLFNSETSLSDMVNIQVELFGFIFSKDGVQISEALDIFSKIKNGDLSALSGFNLQSGDVNVDLSVLAGMFSPAKDNPAPASAGSLDTAGKNMDTLFGGISDVISGQFTGSTQ